MRSLAMHRLSCGNSRSVISPVSLEVSRSLCSIEACFPQGAVFQPIASARRAPALACPVHMAALPVQPHFAEPVVPAAIGPVPDAFVTAIKRSWMVPAPVKTTEPSPVDVACLVEKSLTWNDHDRAQECVRICHKHPLLWQEFLFQEKVEKKRRERNSKRARETLAAAEELEEGLREKQRADDRLVSHFIRQ